MLEVYREIARRQAVGETAALATVVAVRGSTPRKPGAKMIVSRDGSIFGTIGGGCGEAEVRRVALEVLISGQPRLVRVDLTADTESEEGAICGGTMEVFVEATSMCRRVKTEIGGLVLAGGYSTRMATFKPLLRFGGSTMVEMAVRSLLDAGVEDVSVVVGWRADEVIAALGRLRVRVVHNPNYAHGMFSSVLAGVRSLAPERKAVLLLPGDCPLVRVETVQVLTQRYLDGDAPIVYPRFRGRRGHPTLFERRLVESAAACDQPGGLKAVLHGHDDVAVDVDVEDEGVVLDVDVPGDYSRALTHASRLHG